jgi:hypothetical protein
LLLGVLFVAGSLLEAYPREQILIFQFDRKRPIRELRASWLEPGGEELGGAVLHFPEGRTQPVRHPTRLSNGEYEVQIQLTYADLETSSPDARSKTKVARRVTLRGGETPISLKSTTPRMP